MTHCFHQSSSGSWCSRLSFSSSFSPIVIVNTSWVLNLCHVFFWESFPLPLFLLWFPLSVSWHQEQSAGLLFPQSQCAADPSSEGDYPSIPISHTLVSHVSLWSFVSATSHPERRGLSLLADWGTLAHNGSAIFPKSGHVWSWENAFHRLEQGVSCVAAAAPELVY